MCVNLDLADTEESDARVSSPCDLNNSQNIITNLAPAPILATPVTPVLPSADEEALSNKDAFPCEDNTTSDGYDSDASSSNASHQSKDDLILTNSVVQSLVDSVVEGEQIVQSDISHLGEEKEDASIFINTEKGYICTYRFFSDFYLTILYPTDN